TELLIECVGTLSQVQDHGRAGCSIEKPEVLKLCDFVERGDCGPFFPGLQVQCLYKASESFRAAFRGNAQLWAAGVTTADESFFVQAGQNGNYFLAFRHKDGKRLSVGEEWFEEELR